MKTCLSFIAALFVVCLELHSQVVPAANGPATNFSYILRYSQSAQFGGGSGDRQTSTPSGEVDFAGGNSQAPFNLNYIGGYSSTLTGPSYSQGFFQRLSLKQEISGRKWNALVGDDVNYRPQAPITGFSGIPGTGEPIGHLNPSSQSILNLRTHTVNNNATGQLSRILNPAFSISFGGSHDLLRYPDGDGLDTNALSAHGQLTRRVTPRQSISGEYVFSRFSYPVSHLNINTHSGMVIYERSWSRPLRTSIAIGPECISSSISQVVPPSTMVAVTSSLSYRLRNGSMGLSYDRSTAGGSGYLLGQRADSVAGTYSRDFRRHTTIELTGQYRRISALNMNRVIESEFGGIQTSHRLGRFISVFANYTVITQSADLALPKNIVRDPLQILTLGTIFAPRNTNHF
jgi:hypothetical protein